MHAKTSRHPDRDDPHWLNVVGDGRSERTGIALRWKLIRKVNEPWAGKFSWLGWIKLTEVFPDQEAADRSNPDPKRVTTQQSRIVRETAQIRYLKRLHDHSSEEHRDITIGTSNRLRPLIVSHVDRGGRVRIISARQLTRSERQVYEQKSQD